MNKEKIIPLSGQKRARCQISVRVLRVRHSKLNRLPARLADMDVHTDEAEHGH